MSFFDGTFPLMLKFILVKAIRQEVVQSPLTEGFK